MPVIQEIVDLYMKSRNIRRLIQQKTKEKESTKELVDSDISILKEIRVLCDDIDLRTLHQRLAISLNNNDYVLSEHITNKIELLSGQKT
jgi:hypothetical protein